MSVEELIKIQAYNSLPNSQIDKIYCYECKSYEKWYSYCGHYHCSKCNHITSFWVGSGNGMPLKWRKDGSSVYIIPMILKEIKE